MIADTNEKTVAQGPPFISAEDIQALAAKAPLKATEQEIAEANIAAEKSSVFAVDELWYELSCILRRYRTDMSLEAYLALKNSLVKYAP